MLTYFFNDFFSFFCLQILLSRTNVFVEKCMVQELVIGFISDSSVAKSQHFFVLFALIKHLENIAFKVTWVANIAVCLSE